MRVSNYLLRMRLLGFPILRSSWISKAKYCSICTSLCQPNTHPYANHPSQPSTCTSYITTRSNWKLPSWGCKSRREQKKGQRSKETSSKVWLVWARGTVVSGEFKGVIPQKAGKQKRESAGQRSSTNWMQSITTAETWKNAKGKWSV